MSIIDAYVESFSLEPESPPLIEGESKIKIVKNKVYAHLKLQPTKHNEKIIILS